MLKINSSFLKAHNGFLVLKTIYEAGPVSRAEVVQRTHLTPPTVSVLVAGLLAEGLVEEIGFGPSTGGKRPILLRVADDSRLIIGLDLGRGDFRGGLVNLRGKILDRAELPLSTRKGDVALAMVYDLVDELVSRAPRPLMGIGIGAPGLVDHNQGIIRRAVNVDWQDIPLRDLLAARYNTPVYLSNDCQVAALAEYTFNRHTDHTNLAVINIGYGVGGGIIINGQLMTGIPYGAGEIGHVKVVENGERCQCGNTGCLETVLSVRSILRRARVLAPDPERFSPDPHSLEHFAQRAAAGDPAICAVFHETAQTLAVAISHLVGVLGPCRVVIAGEIVRLGTPFLDQVKEELLRRYCLSPIQEVTVEFTRFGADLVLLGGSALVVPRELGMLW